MMDAVKFLKERARMCNANQQSTGVCNGCPAYAGVSHCYKLGEPEDPEKMVAIVEAWAKEHPVKTRQSEFLNLFQEMEVPRENGVLCVNPCEIFKKMRTECAGRTCDDCRKAFWSAEVEE